MKTKGCHIIYLIALSILATQSIAAQDLLHQENVGLYIGSGAFLNIDGTYYIAGDNLLENHGEISLTGDLVTSSQPIVNNHKVSFSGLTNQEISGDHILEFHTLDVNKDDATLRLATNVKVQSELNLLSGKVDIADSDIDLGNNGKILGENGINYITGNHGKISAYINSTSAPLALQNAGNLGLVLTTPDTSNEISIIRNHQAVALSEGNESIKLNFSVTSSMPISNLNIVGINYRDEPQLLNGIAIDELAPYIYINNEWVEIEGENDLSEAQIRCYQISNLDSITLGKSNPIGIVSQHLEKISIFPNPLQNESQLSLLHTSQPLAIKLYDYLGQVVHEQTYNQIKKQDYLQVSMNMFPAGTYLMQITLLHQPNQSKTFKIIKL